MGAVIEKVFNKNQDLIDHYANKIWNESNLGLEKEDIKQELRIKLFLAIKTYSRKWAEYKKTNRNKPIPLKFYLKTTMINRVRDFIKEINSADFVRNSIVGYERGSDNPDLTIEELDIKIGNVSIFEKYSEREKNIFRILMRNEYDVKKTLEHFNYSTKVEFFIKRSLVKLRSDLRESKSIVNEFEIFSNNE